MDNPPEDGPCEVTITAPDRDWLQRFVRQLIEDRLAAAGHLDTMHTTYRWGGEVHMGQEARAVLHTTRSCVAELSRRTVDLHPYEVPCVSATAIVDGSSSYLSWISRESMVGGDDVYDD